MAPKRRVKHLASPPLSVRSERRTKARLDRPPPIPSSSSAPPSRPPSSSTPPVPPPPPQTNPRSERSSPRVSPSSTRSIPFPSRPVTTGRNINFQFLEEEGFSIGEYLKFQGWEFLCSLNLKTYPNLVREFYGNAKTSPTSFTTTVKGVQITLSETILGEIFRAPTEGAIHLSDRQLGLNLLFGRSDILSFEQFSTKFLSIENRLLHHMVARILLPRVGRFDFITSNDIAIMYHLISKEPFNLPAIAFRVMHETAQRKKPALPYGMFLTLIFEEFHISLDDEPSLSLHHYDTYNLKSLLRMKFKKIEGQWIKEGEEPSEFPVPEPESETLPETSLPEPSAPSDIPAPPPVSSIRLDEDQLADNSQRVAAHIASILPSLVTAAVRDALASQHQSADPVPASPPQPDTSLD